VAFHCDLFQKVLRGGESSFIREGMIRQLVWDYETNLGLLDSRFLSSQYGKLEVPGGWGNFGELHQVNGRS
jgi:hypothetical protein